MAGPDPATHEAAQRPQRYAMNSTAAAPAPRHGPRVKSREDEARVAVDQDAAEVGIIGSFGLRAGPVCAKVWRYIGLGAKMSFKEDVADLAKRAISAQAVAQTEEATKNAIVMPFCAPWDLMFSTQHGWSQNTSLMLA
jgi:hypothetical protein